MTLLICKFKAGPNKTTEHEIETSPDTTQKQERWKEEFITNSLGLGMLVEQVRKINTKGLFFSF
jgi:hypothetical protein